MSLSRRFGILALPLLASGCVSMKDSTPIGADSVTRGVALVRELPAELPSEAVDIPGTQYVVVFAQSTAVAVAGAANPIPFVMEAGEHVFDKRRAVAMKEQYAAVDPYLVATDRLQGSPLLTGRADALNLRPLVYLVEGSDGIYRLTLVFRVEDGEWLGRYMYHMPTTYTADQVRQAGPDMLASLRADLQAGADTLRALLERDARGELKGDGQRVTFGSYWLVGGRVGGLTPASLVQFRDARVVEEDADHVVLRSSGNRKAGAREGELAYGVHFFRKDQLHAYKPTAQK